LDRKILEARTPNPLGKKSLREKAPAKNADGFRGGSKDLSEKKKRRMSKRGKGTEGDWGIAGRV